MAIRFSDSNLWNRDWFLDLEGKFQLFAVFLRDHCDCSGIWNPAFKRFEQSTKFRIIGAEYLAAVNKDKERVFVLKNGKWWIAGFIEDQNKTLLLDPKYNPHKGILNSLDFNEAPYLSYGYNLRVSDVPSRLQGKDKDKGKDSIGICIKKGVQGENLPSQENPMRDKRFLDLREAYVKNDSWNNPGAANALLKALAQGEDIADIIQGATDFAAFAAKGTVYFNKTLENWIRERLWTTNWRERAVLEQSKQQSKGSLNQSSYREKKKSQECQEPEYKIPVVTFS